MKKPTLKGEKFTKAVAAIKHGAQVAGHGLAVGGVKTLKVGLNVADPALHLLSDLVQHNPELRSVAHRAIDKKLSPGKAKLAKDGLDIALEQIQKGSFADFIAKAHAYVAQKEAKVKQPSKEGLQVLGQATKAAAPSTVRNVSFTRPDPGLGRTA